jgi:hypothetical protein
MLLYHGSFQEIPVIDLKKCRPGKDFGQGFYLTSSYAQARSFVPLAIKKQVAEGALPAHCTVGYISVFRLHLVPDLAVHLFPSADRDWLHFVAASRRKALFPEIQRGYAGFDIIGGKIANDRTARTLQLYVSGGYGDPGTQEADDIASMTLLPNRLEDQSCFRSEKAVAALEFVRSDRYDTRNL